MLSPEDLAAAVKKLAVEAGFARAGVAAAGEVGEAERLKTFLDRGYHGGMGYMARNLSKRLRPDRLVGGARSVLCLAVGYAPAGPERGGEPFVARYARGRDYHEVLKKRCRRLMDRIREIAPRFEGRAFVDSGPVMERSLAALAGVGWIGRNGSLIVPGLGSYVVLCEILCNLPLLPDRPLTRQCGDCRACVGACPTGAIVADALVDARRCLSYLTVEHRDAIPAEFRPLMGTRLFGCDTCQESCPHNRDVPPGDPELLGMRPPLGGAGLAEVLTWDREGWDAATRGTAARRATHETLLRNAVMAAGNSGDRSLIPLLRRCGRERANLTEPVAFALRALAGS
ncbi:MAG TPA: tRNA epoxyqueuosine(34) reductase QueG [Phycisphaerae bacterium]|nr:tRNA epoxyqueuosine(34) reductase QueG [Phycisphaerae bacterium]